MNGKVDGSMWNKTINPKFREWKDRKTDGESMVPLWVAVFWRTISIVHRLQVIGIRKTSITGQLTGDFIAFVNEPKFSGFEL